MIYFIMLFLFASNVMAQTPEQLSEQNAFPDEIIAELHKENNAVTVLKNTSETKTLPMAIQYLRGGYGSIDMANMMAMIVLSIIPIIIFYLVCQKYIIKGIVAGAVKG